MNENNNIAAVIFDLDGLMIDSERYSFQILQAYAAEFGLKFTCDDNKRLIGRDSTYCAIYLHEEIGIPVNPQQIMDDHWARFAEAIMHEVRPMPGLIRLIGAFQARSFPLAVASNSRLSHIEHALEAIEVRDAFQCILSGEEIGKSKPAPDVYLHAAACLDVSPERCLVLEDSPPGLQSALAAGMRVVVVPSQGIGEEQFNGAFARFPSLEEVLNNLNQILV